MSFKTTKIEKKREKAVCIVNFVNFNPNIIFTKKDLLNFLSRGANTTNIGRSNFRQ